MEVETKEGESKGEKKEENKEEKNEIKNEEKKEEKNEIKKEEKKEEEKEEPDLEKGLIIKKKYVIQKKLGKGGFAKVYLVENIEDGKKYALKVLLQKRNTEKDKRDFFHEMKKLEYLNKKNKKFVLTLHDKGGFTTKDNLQIYTLWLIMLKN